MLFSAAVIYFIILSAAATLYRNELTRIESASEAARALRPFSGRAATALFSLGMVGDGVLAAPVLTNSLANIIAERAMAARTERDAAAGEKILFDCSELHAGRGALNYSGASIMKAFLWAGIIDGTWPRR